jgi:hypothetical protein
VHYLFQAEVVEEVVDPLQGHLQVEVEVEVEVEVGQGRCQMVVARSLMQVHLKGADIQRGRVRGKCSAH